MVITILPIIALLLTLTLAAMRRPRWVILALVGAPALLWAAVLAFVAMDAASPCPPEQNCWYGIEYGIGMVFVAAAAVGVSWLVGGAIGWLFGWLLSRRRGRPEA